MLGILTYYFVLAADWLHPLLHGIAILRVVCHAASWPRTEIQPVNYCMNTSGIVFELILCVAFVNHHTGRDTIICEHLRAALQFLLSSPTVTL